jgi:hypothetical protein
MQTLSSRIQGICRFRPARLIQATLLLLMLGCVVPSFANTLDLTGSLDQTTPDVAIFKLDVSDYANFSAQTIAVPFGISDTELFLFDSSMLGVYGNDDQGGSDSLSMALSCLPSQNPGSNPCGYDGNGFAPSTNGVYYLAVAYSPDTPLDAMGNPIFQTGSTPILEPTGAGSLAGWDNGIYSQPDFDNNKFEIVVTGVPEPSSLLLVAPGLFLGWLRVKRFVKR